MLNLLSLPVSLPVILTVALAVAVIAIIASGYVKAPPDVAYIISGIRKEPRVLIGRAGIKIPFLERKDNLIVKQISVDIKTNGYIPTLDFIGVDIDAIAKIRVRTDPDGIRLAMKNFLNMKEENFVTALTDSLQGNMREIIGTVCLKELCTDRKKFGDEVQQKAQADMAALGIEIISCNIQRIDDENKLILALGQDNMSQIQKDASIAKAQADRDVAIAAAEAKRAANQAEVEAQADIAVRRNELAIKEAELKKESDIKKAEAEAAHKIEEEAQRKTIEYTSAQADIVRQEQEVILKQKEADIREQALNAEVRKKAEAERYSVEQMAAADLSKRQREAEAKLYELSKEAEAKKMQAEAKLYELGKDADAKKMQADAEKYTKLQEAEGIRAVGEAEAAAIQAKGIAEAEAMEKKAEAYQKYNKAAMAEMMIKVLPDVAGQIAAPLAQIDSIKIIGGSDASEGVSAVAGSVPSVMAKLFESMKEATGVDLSEIMRAGSYDAKVNRNITFSGIPGAAANASEENLPSAADVFGSYAGQDQSKNTEG